MDNKWTKAYWRKKLIAWYRCEVRELRYIFRGN